MQNRSAQKNGFKCKNFHKFQFHNQESQTTTSADKTTQAFSSDTQSRWYSDKQLKEQGTPA